MFLKILQTSQENNCARVSFLIELQASCPELYQKRDSGTGVFLWIWQNFLEHHFYRTHLVAASDSVKHLWWTAFTKKVKDWKTDFLVLKRFNKSSKSCFEFILTLHKKWGFPLRISSVSVTKSPVSCRFGHI